jgi:hypothetical protein
MAPGRACIAGSWSRVSPCCTVPAAARPLGDPRRHPRGLPQSRLRHHLLAATRATRGASPRFSREYLEDDTTTSSEDLAFQLFYSLWVPATMSPYATWEYSRIRPPKRSRRRTRIAVTWAAGCGRPAGSFSRGVGGNPGQMHAANAVLDEEQHVQASQEHCIDVEEVRRHDRLRLSPGTSARSARTAWVRDGCRRP